MYEAAAFQRRSFRKDVDLDRNLDLQECCTNSAWVPPAPRTPFPNCKHAQPRAHAQVNSVTNRSPGLAQGLPIVRLPLVCESGSGTQERLSCKKRGS